MTKCDAKVVNSSNISKLLYKKLYNINRKFVVVRLIHYIAIGQLHTLCHQVKTPPKREYRELFHSYPHRFAIYTWQKSLSTTKNL